MGGDVLELRTHIVWKHGGSMVLPIGKLWPCEEQVVGKGCNLAPLTTLVLLLLVERLEVSKLLPPVHGLTCTLTVVPACSE